MHVHVHVLGVVVRSKGARAEVEPLELAAPGDGEVLVRLQASGVCHSDLHYKLGALGDDFPYLLGHEGAGVVEAVGSGVTQVGPGEYVALTYRAPCLHCRFCRVGRLHNCVTPVTATTHATAPGGERITPALDLGTLATRVMVAEGQAVPIPVACPPAVAALLGCGVSTGVGAVLNAAQVEPGASVVVFGISGVGANVVMGARLAHATTIIAVDTSAQKLATAEALGATHTILATEGDIPERVRAITGGNGAGYAFDAVGLPATLRQAIESLEYRGTAVLIGLPSATAALGLPMLPYFFNGTTMRVSLGGDVLPSRDLPRLVDHYLAGDLDLDSLVSREIRLDDVDDAFDAMTRGDVMRSVVVFD